MGYRMGEITPEMDEAIRPFVVDQRVWDLGAGGLGYARHLLGLGASSVVAVDKEGFIESLRPGEQIYLIPHYFTGVEVPSKGIRVAFLSWPTNQVLHGLIDILEQSDVVIYLGSNTDGSACGWRGLFEYLGWREIVAHVPHRRNSLIVYGKPGANRPLVGEEYAALREEMMSFEEAQRAVAERYP